MNQVPSTNPQPGATPYLTLEQFHQQYDDRKGYEYWFGRAVQKGMGTWLHGLLQILLGELLHKAGYFTSSEVDLRIDAEFQPRPDVAASVMLPEAYPAEPIDIVVEILSPDDPMIKVFAKCRHYSRIGIPQILVFDPENRKAWQWNRQTENLELIEEIRLIKDQDFLVSTVWAQLDERLHPKS